MKVARPLAVATAPFAKPAAPRPFERVLAEATRALAGDTDLRVIFGPTGPRLEGDRITLRPIPENPSPEALTLARGQADRLALRHAYHNPQLHTRYRPTGYRARTLFDALEDARCLSLGARDLAGVNANLAAVLHDELRRSNILRGPGDTTEGMSQALTLLLHEQLAGLAIPAEAQALVARWQSFFDRRATASLQRLRKHTLDQEAYALEQHQLLRTLGLDHEISTPPPSTPIKPTAAVTLPAPTHVNPRSIYAADGDVQAAKEIAVEDESDIEPQRPSSETRSPQAKDPAEDGSEQSPAGSRLSRVGDTGASHPNHSYRVYTRAHDEILEATDLCSSEELLRLRRVLDEQTRQLPGIVARLARKLERVLRAQQRRRWNFDLEEGVLDAARLARVLTDPLVPLAFKQETETDFKDTVVTLLLDNSGSMRGRPILLTALCADLLAKTLERCGVTTEILGFTTVEWDGGKARRDWIVAGAPRNPGRLTDVRYIIYKSADIAWRRSRSNLGLLLRDDLMKDNIDGEALWWAYHRLCARPEQRRILMVISDGVPLEQTTLSVNPGGYLDQHLRQVIKWIEERSPVELAAVGIGHDVGDYYSRALAIGSIDELGTAMIGKLAELFVPR
ncbi:MAG: cobaltochelatase subunit CobT [Gammaproteobacteria bacterium]|nr:cobaltochelatase subunit CobT [Gammaproteobacteria bacterium]